MSVVPIVAVVGPTASGKTHLSLDLAEHLGGEILNTDAMQVYRGMDIGTAKLPEAERRGIRHHLLDLLTVRDPLTVAEFQLQARAVISGLRERGATPVLVGGSALYTRAVVDRFEFPGTDPEVRARLETELTALGPHALHERLSAAGSRGGGPDPAGERPPGRARPRGHRDHRPALHGEPAAARVRRLEDDPGRRRDRPAHARRPDRAAR